MKRSRKILILALLVPAGCFAGLSIAGSKYERNIMGDPTPTMLRSRAPLTDIDTLRRDEGQIPGYDDVLLYEDEGYALLTGMDGWFWKVTLKDGRGEKFARAPLIPAGARKNPLNHKEVFFCSSRLHGAEHKAGEKVGVYKLNIRTRQVTPVLLRVPIVPELETIRKDDRPGLVFGPDSPVRLNLSRAAPAAETAGKAITFCNDLDISEDGKRLYFTMPFDAPDASMGGGALREALTLERNARLWRYDIKQRVVTLAAADFTFLDGVLIDIGSREENESILVTETTRFRLLRLFVGGSRSVHNPDYQVLHDSLPGMPDGLDRDHLGRIWIGLLKKRTGVIDFVHRNTWTRPLLLALPPSLLPVKNDTGILCLSFDGLHPLYYLDHDGSRIKDISVVVAGRETLYPAVFDRDSRGFYRLPYPRAAEEATREHLQRLLN